MKKIKNMLENKLKEVCLGNKEKVINVFYILISQVNIRQFFSQA